MAALARRWRWRGFQANPAPWVGSTSQRASTRRKSSKAHVSRGRAVTFGASFTAGADRTAAALFVSTCLHSVHRVSPLEKRSGGRRRLQLEHRGQPMPLKQMPRADRKRFANALGRLRLAARPPRGAAHRARSALDARAPNSGRPTVRNRSAEQISSGQYLPFPAQLRFSRRSSWLSRSRNNPANRSRRF